MNRATKNIIAITGYLPGQSDPEVIINICWAFIFIGGLGLYLVTLLADFLAISNTIS